MSFKCSTGDTAVVTKIKRILWSIVWRIIVLFYKTALFYTRAALCVTGFCVDVSFAGTFLLLGHNSSKRLQICVRAFLRFYPSERSQQSGCVRDLYARNVYTNIQICVGLLLKSNRDETRFCCGLEQFGVCIQCTRRYMAGDTSFRKGSWVGSKFLGCLYQSWQRSEGS